MRRVATRQFTMLRGVQEFDAAHPELFHAAPPAKAAIDDLSRAVAELNQLGIVLMPPRSIGLAQKAASRLALEDLLAAIRRTSRVIAAGTPDYDGQFAARAPRSDASLLIAGRACLDAVTPLAALFIAHGLPETLVADLTAAVDDFAAASDGRRSHQRKRTAARAAVQRALAIGIRATHTLDVIVRNQVRGDDLLLLSWLRARRVAYPHRRKAAGKRRRFSQVSVFPPDR